MVLLPVNVGNRLHDWHARIAFGDDRLDEIGLEGRKKQEAGEQWVRCEDRLPTEDDADIFGNVWCSGFWDNPERGIAPINWANVGKGSAGDTHWMPTNLTRPQPPKGGEPGKDKSCKYCYGGITDGVGNGCTCPQPPKEQGE